MARPKRLYKTKTGRIYYLVKGKRKYVKKDVILPKKGGLIVSTKTHKPKKKAIVRKKTAFALNPQVPLIPQPQQTVGLPIHFAIEQKPIAQIEDYTKQEIKKKEDKKKADDFERLKYMSKIDRQTIPGSIRINKNAKHNIDKLFNDFALKYGSKDAYTWRLFQKSPLYYTAISGEDGNGFFNSRAPVVYNYVPKFIKEKLYEGETTAEESGPEKKRNISEEEREKELLSEMELSESDRERLEKRLPRKRKTKKSNIKGELSDDESINNKMIKKAGILDSSEENSDTKSLTEGRGSSGLYNRDIEDIMKGLKHGPCPVITSDKVNMLLDYVKPGMKKFGAIVNTNPSTSDGSGTDGYRVGHWRSIFFDNDDDGRVSAEYFDPLCEGPIPTSLKKIMSKIAKKMNPEDYSLVKQNYLKRQSDTTNTCGYHCIKFIDDRYNDVPWSEATGYDDYMAKHKPDDSVAGEQSLIKPMKKYDKYI